MLIPLNSNSALKGSLWGIFSSWHIDLDHWRVCVHADSCVPVSQSKAHLFRDETRSCHFNICPTDISWILQVRLSEQCLRSCPELKETVISLSFSFFNEDKVMILCMEFLHCGLHQHVGM